jgi:hypothetical protein
MARLGKVYRGPQVSPWRRLVLRHSRSTAAMLAFAWVGLMLGAIFAGWRPPGWTMTTISVLFVCMLAGGIWAAASAAGWSAKRRCPGSSGAS